MKHTRRDFIKTTGIAIVGISAGATCFSGCSTIAGRSVVPVAPPGSFRLVNGTIRIDLTRTPSLQEIGGAVKMSVLFDNGDKAKLIVIRSDTEVYKAYEDRCTHKGRELNYVHEEDILRCSSFGRRKFDLAGTHIEKPEEESLTIFNVTKEEDSLVIAVA